jgi:hypothetical protein
VKHSPYCQARSVRTSQARPIAGEACLAHLFLVLLEEARRVHAVGDGAAHEGEPVEDDGRLIGVPGDQLAEHVQDDAR